MAKFHRIQEGERLSEIAALHGVAVQDIVAANPHKPLVQLDSGAVVFAALGDGEDIAVPVYLGEPTALAAPRFRPQTPQRNVAPIPKLTPKCGPGTHLAVVCSNPNPQQGDAVHGNATIHGNACWPGWMLERYVCISDGQVAWYGSKHLGSLQASADTSWVAARIRL